MNSETSSSDSERPATRTFDVSSQRIARVYAEALLNAADKQNQTEGVLEEIQSLIDDVFAARPDLEALLSAGAMGRDRRADLIRAAFQDRASHTFLNFLLVLNNHDRLDLLRAVHTACREIYDQRQRRIRVRVQSAVPLEDGQRQRLEQELRDSFHLDPILEEQVDPELLGGLVVRVGDWLYDASVRTQLQTIRNQLIERSSHEIQSRRDRFSSANGD